MTTYNEIYFKIVEKFSETVGDVAITQARNVSSVELDEDNKPKGELDNKDIEELIEEYENIMNKGAIGIAREAVKEAYKEDKSVRDLDLNSNIMPREVKADKFASAL